MKKVVNQGSGFQRISFHVPLWEAHSQLISFRFPFWGTPMVSYHVFFPGASAEFKKRGLRSFCFCCSLASGRTSGAKMRTHRGFSCTDAPPRLCGDVPLSRGTRDSQSTSGFLLLTHFCFDYLLLLVSWPRRPPFCTPLLLFSIFFFWCAVSPFLLGAVQTRCSACDCGSPWCRG